MVSLICRCQLVTHFLLYSVFSVNVLYKLKPTELHERVALVAALSFLGGNS